MKKTKVQPKPKVMSIPSAKRGQNSSVKNKGVKFNPVRTLKYTSKKERG